MQVRRIVLIATSFALAGLVHAQTAADPAPAPAPVPVAGTPSSACCTLPANTVVELMLTEPVSSAHAMRGTLVGFQLAAPIVIDGVTLVPAGVKGGGEVIDAKKAQMGGAAGRLSIAARYLSYNDMHIPLHGLKLGGAGKSAAGSSFAAGLVVGPLGLFVHGGEVEYPNGLLFQAKTGADVVLAPVPAQPSAPSTTPAPVPAAEPASADTPSTHPATQE